MNKPSMQRIRYIPNESVDISSDTVLYRDGERIVTKWTPIHPRNDISGGLSCIYLNEGLKISKFLDLTGNLAYWYCDILDIDYDDKTDTYYFKDLLADIKIHNDGKVELIDLDELADAITIDLVTKEQIVKALKQVDSLLRQIETNEQPKKTEEFMSWVLGKA